MFVIGLEGSADVVVAGVVVALVVVVVVVDVVVVEVVVVVLLKRCSKFEPQTSKKFFSKKALS